MLLACCKPKIHYLEGVFTSIVKKYINTFDVIVISTIGDYISKLGGIKIVNNNLLTWNQL